MANVGKQIKKLRTARNMTQDELAEQLFVSRQTVSNYETGKSNPDIDMLVRIAQVFGTDVNCLIYGPTMPPDRRRDRRRAVILAVVTAVLAAAMAYLIPWAKDYVRQTFIAYPQYILFYIGWPLLMLLTGWTVLDLAGSFLGAKRPKGKYLKWVHWALIALLVYYGIQIVPFMVWIILVWVRPESMNPEYSFFLGFNGVNLYLVISPYLFRACFALIGAGLWLTRREKKTEPAPEAPETSEP